MTDNLVSRTQSVRASERETELNALFRHDFPSIIEALERVGGHTLTLVEEFERIGTGRHGTAIIKRVRDGKGFGFVWRIDCQRLEGLRGRTFDANKAECAASQDFMTELARRLTCDARSLYAVEGGAGYMHYAYDQNKRGGSKPHRVYPSAALRRELSRVAF